MRERKISIIIPTYNRSRILKETLLAIKEQSFQEWECIVVDDRSDDDTIEVLIYFAGIDHRFRYFIRPPDFIKGPASCRNIGLEKAHGEYIQFFDDDDTPYKEMLKKKIHILETSNSDVVVNKVRIINLESGELIKVNSIQSNNLLQDYFQHRISWYICGPMWKKSFLIERFDPSIGLLDDWDFNLRNLLRYPRIEVIEEPLTDYCRRFNSFVTLSKTVDFQQRRSEYYAFKKQFDLFRKEGLVTLNLRRFYVNQLINMIRKIDARRSPLRLEILFEVLRNLKIREIDVFLRLTAGFISFLLINRGYSLVYFRKLKS